MRVSGIIVAAVLFTLPGLVAPAGADVTSPYGINTHMPATSVLDKVAQAGIGWVRVDFNWWVMEPSDNNFNWGHTDQVVNDARARGLEVFPTLAYTPGWASGTGNIADPPLDTAWWYDFVYKTVSRYKDRVKYWGMWNEPNLEHFFTGSGWQYREWILKVGHDAATAADTNCYVLGPELAHLKSGEWWDWFEEVTKVGGSDCIDIVTHHVYKDSAKEAFKVLENGYWFKQIHTPALLKVLDDVGLDDRPLWLTETGWDTPKKLRDEVSEVDQAFEYQNFCWLMLQRDWMDKVFFYEVKDDPTAGIPGWGILRSDNSEKLAYGAYRDFIANPQEPVDPTPGCSMAASGSPSPFSLLGPLCLILPALILWRRRV